ncbi:MAG: hypothetical protein GY869_23495 [Planctomycetes bacterium]|nr:hypothetical protein [Planctomycetota bacterium]
MTKQRIINGKRLIVDDKVVTNDDCCCCTCSTKSGTVSSCFDADKTPDAYVVVFSDVTECSDGGCEDCDWLDGEFCLNHDSGDIWKYTDGNYTITLDLTDSGSTSLVADNNGDTCFTGSIQIDGSGCVNGGYIENDTELGDCSASLCGYGGGALYYHECGTAATGSCCGSSLCVVPEWMVLTLSGMTSCGSYDVMYCDSYSSVITTSTDWEGTWVLPLTRTGSYCHWQLNLEGDGTGKCEPFIFASLSPYGAQKQIIIQCIHRNSTWPYTIETCFYLTINGSGMDMPSCEPCSATWSGSGNEINCTIDIVPPYGAEKRDTQPGAGSASAYFI